MGYVVGGPGQGFMQTFRFVGTAGQTVISGPGASGIFLNYTPGFERVFINGHFQTRGQDYTATNGTSITLPIALDAGDEVVIEAVSLFDVANALSRDQADLRYLGRRNRVVNPAMQISHEHGNSAVGAGQYPVESWFFSYSAAGSAATLQRAFATSPAGSRHRLRMNVTTGKTALTAAEHFGIQSNLEGVLVHDFSFGTSRALPVLLRFGFAGPPGTYTGSLRNADASRSFPFSFLVPSNAGGVDREYVFAIPGDTAGTWATDTHNIGMSIYIAIAAGSNFVGANTNAWQDGNRITPFANNFLSAGTYDLFDVGLYLDLSGGIPPRFDVPDFVEEQRRALRYWARLNHSVYTQANTTTVQTFSFPVTMRANPAVSWSPSFTSNVAAFQVNNIDVYGARSVLSAVAGGAAEWSGLLTANARP